MSQHCRQRQAPPLYRARGTGYAANCRRSESVVLAKQDVDWGAVGKRLQDDAVALGQSE
jgi:hypothetical protein